MNRFSNSKPLALEISVKKCNSLLLIVFIIIVYLFAEPWLFGGFQPAAALSVEGINLYQFVVSANLKKQDIYICQFQPTCSEYTKQAIIKYGLLRGGIIGSIRIVRCNPFTCKGYEPVL